MNRLYRQTTFLTSAAKLAQAPPDTGFEVAFAGRSNAGKSSALNAICDQKSLARTSKTPGRTQLLNFFSVVAERRLVDLPGYGYAKVSEGIKHDWQKSMSNFLSHRNCLRGIMLVMDIRNPLKPFDLQMLDWVSHYGLNAHILLTKADKLKQRAAEAVLAHIDSELHAARSGASVQLFSALKKNGIDQTHDVLDDWLELNQISGP